MDPETLSEKLRKARRSHVLSKEDVCEIRRRYAEKKATQPALASEFGVSKMTISHIVNFKTHRTLECS
jgi:DNA-binding XRE family transcriptional regulator